MVLKLGMDVITWNWAQGTGCQWTYSNLEINASMLVCDNTVISGDDDKDFTIWDLPVELPPLGPADALQPISNFPNVFQHTQPHICFVVNEEDDADFEKRLSLYSVWRVGRQDAAFLPTYLPVDGDKAEYTPQSPMDHPSQSH
ncbi:hypothetical protein FA13DRAFT_1803530 [Coprinellus micaceus]|uniref:Uncharacterized protein n=1 Tax=Coprinellus micaceus TaxID=71717 RepID=A0A4Y7SA99_COPMI|nr:hypothetical protein FA13DRAFT_1803530 [Coprinellus micaceus]